MGCCEELRSKAALCLGMLVAVFDLYNGLQVFSFFHLEIYFIDITCCRFGEIVLMTRCGIYISSTCNGLELLEAVQVKHACSGCIFSSPWKCLIDLNMTDAL